MKEFGIDTAFAFDNHFVQAGFKKLPEAERWGEKPNKSRSSGRAD
jgi:hypothetical protein